MSTDDNSFVFTEPNQIQSLAASVTAEHRADGAEVTHEDRVRRFASLIETGAVRSSKDILPLIFQLDGKNYNLDNHFPFEDIYRLSLTPSQTWRTARQVAKCVVLGHGACRYDRHGCPIYDEELRVGDLLLGLNDRLRWAKHAVVGMHERLPSPCVRVQTRLGADLLVTADHPFRTLHGYTFAAALQPGYRVAALRRAGMFGQHQERADRIMLTAYMIGDGCCGLSHNWSFHSVHGAAYTEFLRLVRPLEQQGPAEYSDDRSTAHTIKLHVDNLLVAWLKADELAGKPAHEKRVPAWVFQLGAEDTRLFISRLWATDGRVGAGTNCPDISYSTVSRRLSRDVRALLLKFGIPTSINRRPASYIDAFGTRKICRDAYKVRVETRKGWQTFQQLFDVPGKPPQPMPATTENNNRDTIPNEISLDIAALAELCQTPGDTLHAHGLRRTPEYAPSRRRLRGYIDYFQQRVAAHGSLSLLQDLADGDVIWDSVTRVETIGEQPSWDVEVDGAHNYALDNVVVHNTTNMATFGISMCVANANFKSLYVTPLFEQIRRFSSMYVGPFINNSPLKRKWLDHNSTRSVLHRTFSNGSSMLFSFALLDADRMRGISADLNWIDELQDMNREHLPIIRETMSHSDWELRRETGTPKTLDNILEGRWNESSQAEWFIPCYRCTTNGNPTFNIPSMDHHIERMIGPWHEDISEKYPAVICHKCGKPISPRHGFWKHRWPERMFEFAGYHIPQIIMPLHYAKPKKWAVILAKQQGRGQTPTNVFYNEVLGEGYDMASKLVSLTELRAASSERPNTIAFARQHITSYALRVLAVDWGGGGRIRVGSTYQSLSLTTCAVLGLRYDGRIDVLYGERLLTPHDHLGEARKIYELWQIFRPNFLAHDYSGAGQLRETFLVQAGVPPGRTMPMQYVRSASQTPLYHVAPTQIHPRSHYRVDKARMLLHTCAFIRLRRLRFFKYDHIDQNDPGLIHDFLSLIEENVQTASVRPIYKISCADGMMDDFAQAVAMGCVAIWYRSRSWPNLPELAQTVLTPDQVEAAGPADPQWADDLDEIIPEY